MRTGRLIINQTYSFRDYFQFHDHPELIDVCDLILINCYPFWEGSDINKAAQYQEGVYRVIKNIAMGK